jgi:hypothetical protein
VDTWRLPASEGKRAELAKAYGRDGFALLAAVYRADAPAWLQELPAVEALRVVLLQNYTQTVTPGGREVITRREADTDGLPPGRLRLTSPYDVDARWASSVTRSGTATSCTSARPARPTVPQPPPPATGRPSRRT